MRVPSLGRGPAAAVAAATVLAVLPMTGTATAEPGGSAPRGATAAAAPPAAAPPAAAPRAAAAAPAAVPTRNAPGDPLPVSVTLEALEPRDVRADSTLRVVAVLRNTGDTATGPLTVPLQRRAVMTTRGELGLADADSPGTGQAIAPAAAVDGELTPGQAARVTYATSAGRLRL